MLGSDPAPIVLKGKVLYFSATDEGFCSRASKSCNMKLKSIASVSVVRDPLCYHTLNSNQYVFQFKLDGSETEPAQAYRIKLISFNDGPTIDKFYSYWVMGYDIDRETLVWMLVAHEIQAKKLKA